MVENGCLSACLSVGVAVWLVVAGWLSVCFPDWLVGQALVRFTQETPSVLCIDPYRNLENGGKRMSVCGWLAVYLSLSLTGWLVRRSFVSRKKPRALFVDPYRNMETGEKRMSVCQSVCLWVWLAVCGWLVGCLSVWLAISLAGWLDVCLSVWPADWLVGSFFAARGLSYSWQCFFS